MPDAYGTYLLAFGQVLQRLADNVEAAGHADEVLAADAADRHLDGLGHAAGDLAHLAGTLLEELLQVLRARRARRGGGAREDHLVGAEVDLVDHLADVLVRAAAEDADHAVVRHVRAHAAHQRVHGSGVVRAVAEDPRAMRNHLHPAGHLGGGQAGGELVLGQLEAEALQDVGGGERKAAVDGLVLARHRHRYVFEAAGLGVEADARVRPEVRGHAEAAGELDVLVHDAQVGAHLGGHLAHHGIHLGVLLEEQRGHALLEDPGLLAGDLPLRGAEQLGVVEVDGGDDAHERRDHVRRVEAAAQAHLHHRDVHGLLREVRERHRGHQLEERRLLAELLRSLGHGAGHLDEVGLADLVAVDGDALADVDEVRAGVGAHRVAGAAQHRRDHRHRAALAVGAGDMNHRWQLLLRIPQAIE